MLAEDLIDVHSRPREVAPFSEAYPGLTLEAAYEAASALHRHRLAQGWRPLGRKIGFTNRTLWPRYGVYEPMWGTLYDRTAIFASGERAEVPLAGLIQPRIEPEICFGLKKSVAAGRLLDSIEWIAHSIEIVQCHHPKWKVTLPDCAADNGLHGRLVIGTRVPISEIPGLEERLPALGVALKKAGTVIDRGVGANVLDSPLLALAHLVEVLGKQPAAPRLEAGEIVTTGTLTDAHPVSAGESWSTELAGLPLAGLSVRFR